MVIWLLTSAQGGRGVMQFGRSRAKRWKPEGPVVTFADVAGIDEAVEELVEVKEFLAAPSRFEAVGARIPKGVLLYGPPGTGKTLLARAVAGEAGVPFFSISGSDFVEMFVGVGASRVRDLFNQAKAQAPAIVFVDEIDAVGRHRGAGLGGGHDEREQTLNQLLVEMDGFDTSKGVILIAGTNRPDILDPALLRPGRFDRHIAVDPPDLEGRKAILAVHAKGKPIDPSVNLTLLARRTPGFTGADLANVLNESALLAARRGAETVTGPDVEAAVERVMAGPEKKARVMSAREKRVIAYHEAGHALVGHVVPERRPHPQGVDRVPGPGPRLDAGPARGGPHPPHPLAAPRPAGHAARRPLRRGARVRRPHDGRPERHRAGHPDRPVDGDAVGHEQRHRPGPAGRARRRRRSSDATAPAPGSTPRPSPPGSTTRWPGSWARPRSGPTELLRRERLTLDRLAAALVERETLDVDELAVDLRRPRSAGAGSGTSTDPGVESGRCGPLGIRAPL